jgi:hypothetical protein
MRIRLLGLLALAAAAGSLTLSLIRGQERADPPAPPAGTSAPAARTATPAGKAPAATKEAPTPDPAVRDPARLSPLQKQFLLGARRGADWLYRMNGVKGRFVPGYLPALKTEMDADSFLRQAGAAFALARAARFTGEERYAARATQALLALLDDTTTDPRDPAVRYTALPPSAVNRLGAAGLLVLAIHELPRPESDLLEKSEQLCNYVRRQARPDGSLDLGESPDGAVSSYPGIALYALMRSQKLRPANWKEPLVRKALGHYRARWRAHKDLDFVPWQTAAYAEAFLQTKAPEYADFVNEMNDWLCTLQYAQIDPRHMLWLGGFMAYSDGRPVDAPPTVGCAHYAEGLAEACRVARAAGDLTRHQRYTDALEKCLQFLTTLQYTEAGTQHFADWYRERLVGAFHGSHQDGNLRLDYTQHAVSALVQYLEHVASSGG